MGKLYTEIDAPLARFITSQAIFFVATAPLDRNGHVNCSPKGLDSLRVLDPHTVAYLDFVGSGVETIAHLRENGRIVLMFCAFQGPPKIVRIHGKGTAIERSDPQFEALLESLDLPASSGIRSIIKVRATRISDSCGFGVPLLRFEGNRDQLAKWAERKDEAAIEVYKATNNSHSIDGLAGLRR